MSHTRRSTVIGRVLTTYTYRGESHTGRYRPDPAIEALDLPLTAGKRWSGGWRGSTSGSYRIDVGGFDQIQAAGRSIRAARVVVRMEFRGAYRGYSVTTIWVDPSSRVTVASVGSIEVTGDFGRYTTDFDTRLEDGPGY
jgi:hypothetical protein